MYLWLIFVLLKTMKSFSWKGCVVQATKNKENSCSFFHAIGRCLCSPSADWLKIDMWKNPFFNSSRSRQLVGTLRCTLSLSLDKQIETAGRYATVHFVTLLGLALRLTFKSRLGLLFNVGEPSCTILKYSGVVQDTAFHSTKCIFWLKARQLQPNLSQEAGGNLLFQFWLANFFPTTIREKLVLKLIISFFFDSKMMSTAHWFEQQDEKRMSSHGEMCVYLCIKHKEACTAWMIHSTVVSFFLGCLSIMFVKFWHLCVLFYVWPRQARTMPSLQLQEHRKRVVRRLPIMYTTSRSNNRLTRDPLPPPTKQTSSLFGVSCSS